MKSVTAATYTHGTAVLAESVSVPAAHVSVHGGSLRGLGMSAGHGVATGAGQWLPGAPMASATGTAVASIALSPICSALRSQSAQDACTGTAVFGGGSFSVQAGSPVVIADDKPNFRTGRPPRDRQPV